MSVNDASRIIIDNSRVTLQIVASLTYSRGVIYDHNMFIVHATELNTMEVNSQWKCTHALPTSVYITAKKV
jgi:hypothetical protein